MTRRPIVPAIICAAVLMLLMTSGAFAQGETEPAGKGSCCRYVGDINHSGVDGYPNTGVPLIDDMVYLVTYMFDNGPCDAMCETTGIEDCMRWEQQPNFPEADINGDGSPIPDIVDLVYLLTYMAADGPAPVGWIDQYTPACEK